MREFRDGACHMIDVRHAALQEIEAGSMRGRVKTAVKEMEALASIRGSMISTFTIIHHTYVVSQVHAQNFYNEISN